MKMHYSSKTTTGVLFGNLFVDDSLTIDKITYHKHLFMNISNYKNNMLIQKVGDIHELSEIQEPNARHYLLSIAYGMHIVLLIQKGMEE